MIEGSSQGSGTALRYGMVGGGPDAFIGEVHRKAIALDGGAGLAAGCFSRSLEGTLATGRGLGLGAGPALPDLRGDGRGRGEAGPMVSISWSS